MFEPEIENKSLTTPTTPIKKKRGRPFKNKPAEETAKSIDTKAPSDSADNLTKPLKPKRGRPFKKKEPIKTNTLTEVEFWKYKALSTDDAFFESSLKEIGSNLKVLEYQAELLRTKMLHLKGPVTEQARKKLDDARSAFQSFKDDIESKLGFSLNGAEIDNETFEVKKSTSTTDK